MPVKVLLRGFAPDIPEDQLVTFSNALPESLLCIQCNNVSSKLYRDTGGHGYCVSCKGMCTTWGSFNCATCGEDFSVEQLVLDEAVRSEIQKEKVICPHTSAAEAVEIPFTALKAHLKGCCCKSAVGASNVSKQDGGIQPNAMDPEEPAEPFTRQTATGKQSSSYRGLDLGTAKTTQLRSLDGAESVQVSTCSNCKQRMPKKLIQEHLKLCLKSHQRGRGDSLQCKGITQQERMTNPPPQPSEHFQEHFHEPEAEDSWAGEMPSGQYHSAHNEVALIPRLCQMVNDLEKEVRELKRTITKKDNDNELLKETMAVLQEDMRGVQIRCEGRIAKVEKVIADLECQPAVLNGIVAANDEVRHRELQEVHAMVGTMHASSQARIAQLEDHFNNLCTQLKQHLPAGSCAIQ